MVLELCKSLERTFSYREPNKLGGGVMLVTRELTLVETREPK
jgi:hypothetical protein